MGVLANCYQEHCRNDISAQNLLTYTSPQKKGNCRKAAFFWGRVYTIQMHYAVSDVVLQQEAHV